jgi:hypothetical protein
MEDSGYLRLPLVCEGRIRPSPALIIPFSQQRGKQVHPGYLRSRKMLAQLLRRALSFVLDVTYTFGKAPVAQT